MQSAIIKGFSKLNKKQKIDAVSMMFTDPRSFMHEVIEYWHNDHEIQKLFDEFSENTISNFYLPYGVAPNFIIDEKTYMIPMVIEESSVIAAASKAAKFWSDKGGFHTRIIGTTKLGQVHFSWRGDKEKLQTIFPEIRARLMKDTKTITSNMVKRGGGILDIQLIDMTHEIADYFQLKASFETIDSMGANFINSCLEEFGESLRSFISEDERFETKEKDVQIIMAILSNYTPDCLVECWVECDIEDLNDADEDLSGEEFAWKFEKAIRIAEVDVHRATTHNKGIYNGIDSVILATGNDFRAIEACGHAYAARNGKYSSLSHLELRNGKFRYTLKVPIALGTVGGLTSLHPLAKRSMQMLGNPKAKELMRIAAVVGLANNFGAIKSLVTKGIQVGHMKMHLFNILNSFNATEEERELAVEHFKTQKVSVTNVSSLLEKHRKA
ncbi:MAG: hydroxymethylglutaryl-CoA reductase [Bacteroidales bacterium]|nr:hydroxymethylglutaryl-CoA reductase [Bacteroidales bacterium]